MKPRNSIVKPSFPQLMYPEHAHLGNGEFVVLMDSSETGMVVWSDNEDFPIGSYIEGINVVGECYIPYKGEIVLKNE